MFLFLFSAHFSGANQIVAISHVIETERSVERKGHNALTKEERKNNFFFKKNPLFCKLLYLFSALLKLRKISNLHAY